MRSIAFVLIAAMVLLPFSACTEKTPEQNYDPVDHAGSDVTYAPDPNDPDAPTLILNGEMLDVYTSHYELTEERAVIPLHAFLQAIGAKYADSPINAYGKQCYSFMGKRLVMVPDMHLFMPENDYLDFLQELEEEGKQLSRETAANRGLLPQSSCWECERSSYRYETVIGWSDIMVDHISLMNALIDCGINITIEYNYSTRTITVICSASQGE